MMREDLQKIQEEIDEVLQPHELLQGRLDSLGLYETRIMHLGNLKEKMRRRSRQVPYGSETYLEVRSYKIPNIIHRAIHTLGCHDWILAEHEMWGTLRICPLCGRTEWTIYPIEINAWKICQVQFNGKDLMKFIKEWKEMNK